MKPATSRDLRRHLAAVMFTDMAGYTALMQRDEAAALRSRYRHRCALERSVPGHDGILLQYFGDGSLSIFHSSVQAVEAAIEIQRELGGEPALRIGLHLGDIAYDEQGAYGDAINIAARLESLAVPGGILISEKVFDDIRRHPELAVMPVGSVRLKNVCEAVRTFALAVEGIVVPADSIPTAFATASGLPVELLRRLEDRALRPALATPPTGTFPGRVPLVGRDEETAVLRGLIERAEERTGGTVFFRGPRGVGKSRLVEEVAEFARRRGWTVLSGRAYFAEQRVPFGPFSEAFLPILQGLDPDSLEALAPAGYDALCALFPVLGTSAPRLQEQHGEPGELQAQLFWHFSAMLARLADYRPLLLVLEDLDFADRSSLELLRFVARQSADKAVLLIAVSTGMYPEKRRTLLEIMRSLDATNACTVIDLKPLGRSETGEFVERALHIEAQDTSALAELLFHWTLGNPFFLVSALRGLVEASILRREGRTWQGLGADSLQLPHSVRDAVLAWMGHLSASALQLAELLAVLGREVEYDALLHASGLAERDLARALEELQNHQILTESEDRWRLLYDFRHPLLRETLRSEITLARRRQLHTSVAESLEAYYGDGAEQHADELAYHFGHASPGPDAAKAIRYLAIAGERALRRNANREAAACLQEAFDRIEATPVGPDLEGVKEQVSIPVVMGALARARRRLGETRQSVALWRRMLATAQAADEPERVARLHREIGLTYMAGGVLEEAVDAFEHALNGAREVGDLLLMIRTQLAQAMCFHAAGRGDVAATVVDCALRIAEALNQPAPLGRVHSAALRLHIWTGQLDRVRAHAEKALELSARSGDRGVEFWSHWAMGAMEGLIGNTEAMGRRIEKARALAEEIGSPFLRLETVELGVELAYARGEWDEALAIGEPAIELARSLGQTSILPRLLVWVSRVYLGRADLARADMLTREAWDVSGADRAVADNDFRDVHSVVPAHVGRAAYHLGVGEWSTAVRIAEAGLAIADRTGYVVWAMHHILPIIAEASIHARDLARATEIGRRMRRDAEAVGHPLGLAWADACDAVLTWLQGDPVSGVIALRKGAEALESIPLKFEAARMRRQLAARLSETGDRESAIEQLKHVHEVFRRLGAEHELDKTTDQLGELDAGPGD